MIEKQGMFLIACKIHHRLLFVMQLLLTSTLPGTPRNLLTSGYKKVNFTCVFDMRAYLWMCVHVCMMVLPLISFCSYSGLESNFEKIPGPLPTAEVYSIVSFKDRFELAEATLQV